MRGILIAVLCGWFAAAIPGRAEELPFDHTHAAWASVLAARVDAAGRVDYAAIAADPADLLTYLRGAARVEAAVYRGWTREQQLAYLINLYNAQTVDLVRRHLPLRSIKDLGSLWRGAWGQPVVTLFGKITTLDFLQHQVIRPMFGEPGVHFALTPAARGAPPLRGEPYVAERLEEQLRDQAVRFFSDPARNRIDATNGVVYLSKLFDWHGADFTAGGGGLPGSLMPWLPPDWQGAWSGATFRVRFLEFDWRLNGR